MDYYTLLGVPPDADADTLRRAFRAQVRRFHPDAGAGSSPERFRQVVQAYETLSDPGRRRAYDRARRPKPVEPILDDYAARRELFRQFDDIQRAFDQILRRPR